MVPRGYQEAWLTGAPLRAMEDRDDVTLEPRCWLVATGFLEKELSIGGQLQEGLGPQEAVT